MSQLKMTLFGMPQIEVDGLSIDLGRRKAIALLAYLAVTNQPHSRDTLATLLWPDYSQVNSRAVLRSVLKSVKAAFGGSWLQIERDAIALNQDENSWVDVSEFRRLIAESQAFGDADGSTWPSRSQLLANAVELYRDDF